MTSPMLKCHKKMQRREVIAEELFAAAITKGFSREDAFVHTKEMMTSLILRDEQLLRDIMEEQE